MVECLSLTWRRNRWGKSVVRTWLAKIGNPQASCQHPNVTVNYSGSTPEDLDLGAMTFQDGADCCRNRLE